MKRDPDDIRKLSKTSRFDRVLIGLILFISVSAILWIGGGDRAGAPTAKTVDIYHGSHLMKTVSFVEDKGVSLPGVGMEIGVEGGKVRVLKSDCPRQICVSMGWIAYPGDTIVCVPNKVLIEIKSSGNGVDAVVS